MLDINDLLDYVQDDCVFDIYDCDKGLNIKESIDREELESWVSENDYELCSFEPIQRKDRNTMNCPTIFGIVWNVEKVEER